MYMWLFHEVPGTCQCSSFGKKLLIKEMIMKNAIISMLTFRRYRKLSLDDSTAETLIAFVT